MNKENRGDLISRRVLKGLISDKSIPIKFEEGKRGNWQNSLGLLLSDIYKIIDNAPAVEPCKDCEDRKQAEYIRHGSSWHELQALRKFKEEHERPQGEWIPVSERLPDISERCIVQLTDGYITIGSYLGIDNWMCKEISSYSYPTKCIIAWQPSPESYKKGGAE